MTAIVTPAEMYAAEQRVFASGIDSFSVMQAAGEGVADALQARWPDGRIRVLCGPGGNGGDGFVAAARLRSLGRAVEVYLLGAAGALKGDCARAAALWDGPVWPIGEAVDRPAPITLDALFGGGLSRPLSGVLAELARQAGTVVSVDVPSGLDALSARPLGACFEAALTVTFAGYRPGHVLSPGRALCGETLVHEIGVPLPLTVRINEPAIPEAGTVLTVVCLTGADMDAHYRPAMDGAANRIDAARAVAQQTGQLIMLEETELILASPDGRCVVDTQAASLGIDVRSIIDEASIQGRITLSGACAAIWAAHAGSR